MQIHTLHNLLIERIMRITQQLGLYEGLHAQGYGHSCPDKK